MYSYGWVHMHIKHPQSVFCSTLTFTHKSYILKDSSHVFNDVTWLFNLFALFKKLQISRYLQVSLKEKQRPCNQISATWLLVYVLPLVQSLLEFLLKSFHIFKILIKALYFITDLTFTKTSLLDKAFHMCFSLCDYPLLECSESKWYKKISEWSGYW